MSGDLEREIITVLAQPPDLPLYLEELLFPLAAAVGAPRDHLRCDAQAVLRDLCRRGDVVLHEAAGGESGYTLSSQGRRRYAHALGVHAAPENADVLEEVDLDTELARWSEDVPRALAEVRRDLANGNGPRALARMAELRIDLQQLSARADVEVTLGPHAWPRRPAARRLATHPEDAA